MKKRWLVPNPPDNINLTKLAKSLNIRATLAQLLIQRGITTFEKAKTFFRPSLDHLHDPFLMKGMGRAVNRLAEAISQGERILIYGDYDVDGTTSVALMYSFLRKFTPHINYYIPDRHTEGYGISQKGILWAREEGFDLIISLDCGIRATKQAKLAKDLDMDLIICDHHLPGSVLPDAYAILDPKQPDDDYPYKDLSGCGVGFKLLQAFCIQNTIPLTELYQFLDLLAVSIASDIVPITGENRVLAYYGLKKLNKMPCPGLKALIGVSSLSGNLDISDVVFYIGPRINATGRLRHAKDSVKLLVSATEKETEEYAVLLNQANTERKNFDQNITAEAIKMVESDSSLTTAKSTVLFKNDWHKGVIGIVASRCIEKYYRPTIILTESKNKATGSARSVDGFDIHEAISACEDLLEQFGGHTHAAGLTLSLENVKPFQKKFEEVVAGTIQPELLSPKIEVDLEVDFDFINYKTFGIIQQMAPFGPKNPNPVFLTRNLKLRREPIVLKEQHLKIQVYQEGHTYTHGAIGFGLAEKAHLLKQGAPFQMVYQIEENEYLGNKSLQLNIKDIKID